MTSVRRATEADADALGVTHAASWRVAYAHLGEEFLASIDEAERADMWRSVLADPNEKGPVFVVDGPMGIAGFVNVRANRDETQPPHVGELVAIYAHPDAWGAGVGRSLMQAAIAELRSRGFTEATLWVLDDNARAQRFYELDGWRPDGAFLDEVWRGAAVREVRYRRQLTTG